MYGRQTDNAFLFRTVANTGMGCKNGTAFEVTNEIPINGAAMKVPSMPPPKSPLLPCSRCAAIAFLAFATIFAPTFSSTATAVPQGSTLLTLAEIREAWVQDLRSKQLEPILKFYAPDAVFLQPTGERITGSVGIAARVTKASASSS
jgi:hypothetical protein